MLVGSTKSGGTQIPPRLVEMGFSFSAMSSVAQYLMCTSHFLRRGHLIISGAELPPPSSGAHNSASQRARLVQRPSPPPPPPPSVSLQRPVLASAARLRLLHRRHALTTPRLPTFCSARRPSRTRAPLSSVAKKCAVDESPPEGPLCYLTRGSRFLLCHVCKFAHFWACHVFQDQDLRFTNLDQEKTKTLFRKNN